MPDKNPNTVRWGGPGSSNENAHKPPPEKHDPREPGTPTNRRQSNVSSGGGELDSHHTHDPREK